MPDLAVKTIQAQAHSAPEYSTHSPNTGILILTHLPRKQLVDWATRLEDKNQQKESSIKQEHYDRKTC